MSALVVFFRPSSVTPHLLLKVLKRDVKSRVRGRGGAMRMQPRPGAQMDQTISPKTLPLLHKTHTRLRRPVEMLCHCCGKPFANMLGQSFANLDPLSGNANVHHLSDLLPRRFAADPPIRKRRGP